MDRSGDRESWISAARSSGPKPSRSSTAGTVWPKVPVGSSLKVRLVARIRPAVAETRRAAVPVKPNSDSSRLARRRLCPAPTE